MYFMRVLIRVIVKGVFERFDSEQLRVNLRLIVMVIMNSIIVVNGLNIIFVIIMILVF